MLINLKPRIRQPPFGSVQVDWSSPLARGLRVAFVFNGKPFYNLANPGLSGTIAAGAVSLQVREQGLTAVGDATPGRISTPSWFWNPAGRTGSAVFWAKDAGAGASREVMEQDDQASLGRTLFGYQAANVIQLQISGTNIVLGATTIGAGSTHLVGFSQDAAGNCVVYLDGKSDGTGTNPDNYLNVAGNLLARTNGTNPFPGNVYLVYSWTRVVTAAEMLWIAKEPYALLQPIPAMRYMRLPAAAPSDNIRAAVYPISSEWWNLSRRI